jgi:hypothetical protein
MLLILDLVEIGWGRGLDLSVSGQSLEARSCEYGKGRRAAVDCWEVLE